MVRKQINPQIARQHGFTLIEVMVTALLVGFGMLGLGMLQMTGIKYSQSASLHDVAVTEVGNIFADMRVNKSAVITGDYDTEIGSSEVNRMSVSSGGGESASSVAASNITDWKERLAENLPGGDVEVECNNTLCTVTVQWSDVVDLQYDAENGNKRIGQVGGDGEKVTRFVVTSQL